MTKDRKVLYAMSGSIFALLLLIFFMPKIAAISRIITASCLLLAAAACQVFLKKRIILSINKRSVLMIMGTVALLFVTFAYLSGLHFGFDRTLYPFSASVFFKNILPILTIIVTTEIIRYVLLSAESRVSTLFAYLIPLIAEILSVSNMYGFRNFSAFMDMFGLTLVPALIANLVFTYISKRYGYYPSIVYRAIITLYPYLIPYQPAVPDAMLSLAKLLVPVFIYLFVSALYEKRRRFARARKSKLVYVGSALVLAFMISVVMLISCKFTYGMLVIGSNSMADEINKGDAIIYEAYGDETADVGDVIVFEKGGVLVIHRVVDIERVDMQNRYYTQGDANEDMDIGYVTDANIVGICKLKIAYVGYPTILLRNIFSK